MWALFKKFFIKTLAIEILPLYNFCQEMIRQSVPKGGLFDQTNAVGQGVFTGSHNSYVIFPFLFYMMIRIYITGILCINSRK